MKPIKLITFIPLMLIYLSSLAQITYKLGPPKGGNNWDRKMFSLKIKDTAAVSGDTSVKVVRVVYNDVPVISYKINIVWDSLMLTYFVSDSTVYDSVFYDKLLTSDSLRNAGGLRIMLINAAEKDAAFPIIAFYQSNSVRIDLPKISNTLDSIKKDKPIKINGNITAIGQYSDNKYLYQTIPQNYVRTYVNINADVFGLPFSTGYYYSTESNAGLNKINNFRLSFNYDKFNYNIQEKLKKKVELSSAKHLDQFADIDIESLNMEAVKLKHELNTDEYKKKLEKYNKIIAIGEVDTSFKKTYKYKRAVQKNIEYKKSIDRLKELEDLKEKYLKYNKMADIDRNLSTASLSNPKNYRRAAKRFGLVKPGQSIFLSMKKLDIGTFDPDYTALVLSGVNLTGVNVELNPGYAYGAFTWGKVIANFDNPLNFSAISGGRNIISGRIGIGNKDKFLVAFSVLKGTDDAQNQVKDSTYDYYLPNTNYVIGMDARYKFSSNAEAGVEYAKTKNELVANTSASSGESIGELINPEQTKYTNAFNAFANINFNKSTSKIKMLTRLVDPFYYSFGTPYLRRDNFRVELKGEQLLWKKQLIAGVTFRRDADNLYDLKQGTSINNSIIYNIQLRIKRYPYLSATYSPNYQSFYNSSSNKQTQSYVKLYSLILGYTYQSKEIITNSMISYTKQYNKSNQVEWSSFDVNQYAVNESVNLRKLNLVISSGIIYSQPLLNGDTGKTVIVSLKCTKGILKNKATVSSGVRYSKDFTQEERYIAEAGTGFGLGFGIRFQLQLEKHFITSYTTSNNNTDMFIGRINIIKSF